MIQAGTREGRLVWGLLAVMFVCGATGVVLVGCGCSAIGIAGLHVTVVDGATGAPICDATVTAQDGDYNQALLPAGSAQGDCSYAGAYNRPGTYTVTATVGSRSKVVTGVRVPGDANAVCDHVATQSVTITLDP